MSPTLVSLCLFSGLTILLVFCLANYRLYTSMTTGKAPNTFTPDGSDLSDFGTRLTRAHLNCLEMLPLFAAVALAAVGSGRLGITDGLAMPFVYARFGQSLVHLISTAVPAVFIRAGLFVAQLVILVIWIYRLITVPVA